MKIAVVYRQYMQIYIHSQFKSHQKVKRQALRIAGFGEMAQKLQARIGFAEVQAWFPKPTWAAHNHLRSRSSDALLQPLQASAHTCLH